MIKAHGPSMKDRRTLERRQEWRALGRGLAEVSWSERVVVWRLHEAEACILDKAKIPAERTQKSELAPPTLFHWASVGVGLGHEKC